MGISLWLLAGIIGGRAERPGGEGAAPARLLLARAPAIGVSCKVANDISCDRVGVAVWLRRPTKRLAASIDGRPVRLRVPCGKTVSGDSCASYCRRAERDQPCGTLFEGFLMPAGLMNGPLKVRTDLGTRWLGDDPPSATMRLRTAEGGSTEVEVPVWAGWG
jgi:hypothetical protein